MSDGDRRDLGRAHRPGKGTGSPRGQDPEAYRRWLDDEWRTDEELRQNRGPRLTSPRRPSTDRTSLRRAGGALPRSVVAYVIAEEVALGRVREEDGRYWLVTETFRPAVLAALRSLAPLGAEEPRPPELPRPDRRRPDLLTSEALLAGRRAGSAS